MKPQLSICVPTYNRSGCLKECLDSIMVSVSGYESQIEIIVSDNDSIDDTIDIIRSFQIKYSWIRYYRNDSNIGGEENFYRLFTLTTGDYVWLIGDDDKLAQEAISIVMNSIDRGGGKHNLLVCDYSKHSKNFKEKKAEFGHGFNTVSTITNHNDLMKMFGWRLGYISSVIFKRPIFLSSTKQRFEKYYEYGFSFLYMIYHGVINDCSALYINKPLVCNRMDNSIIHDSWKYFVAGISIILNDLKNEGYSAQSINRTKNKMIFYYVIPHIVSLKIKGDLTIHKWRELFYNYRKCLNFWFFCVPILLMPSFCLRQVKKIKHTVIRLKNV